jgi:hypothetical protein|tara:strand:- start:111 stop:398 length:288 start_codon:yes stop_codon:yes gene_type:complete
MKTIAKLVRENTNGNNQKLLLDLINGIGSLEQAKKHFSHYLTTIENKSGEYFISLGAFENGLNNAIEKQDVVNIIATINALILKLKSGGEDNGSR